MSVVDHGTSGWWVLGSAAGLLFTAAACGGLGSGDTPLLEGPSPTEQLRMLGVVQAPVQQRPGEEARLQAMSVAEAPNRPPRGSPEQVPMHANELVVGVEINGEVVAYPLRYLNLVEVVNDEVGGTPVAVSWCPLAGTALTFHREMGGEVHTFHFGTGLIHDSLLLVDDKTGSVWAQISRKAISGPFEGEELEVVPSLQTTWEFWNERHPETQVMGFPQEQGHHYHYAVFPADSFPHPPPRNHDPTALGIGVTVDGKSRFSPLRELDQLAPDDLPELAEGDLRIQYDPGGLVAWVEDADGGLVDSQMAYERAWLAFYPDSEVYRFSGR